MAEPSPSPLDDGPLRDAVAALRRETLAAGFARYLGVVLPGALALTVAAGFALRLGLRWPLEDLVWLLGLPVLAPPVAWLLARRLVPRGDALAVWLDQRAGGTGRILTQLQLHDPRWAREALLDLREAARAPRIERDWAPTLWRSLPALLLLAVVVAVEPAPAAPLLPTALFDTSLARLAERVGTLDELGLLGDERLADLTERLEDIRDGLDAGDLERAFEAMDRMGLDLDREADDLAATLDAARAALEGLDPEDREELSKGIRSALEGLTGAPIAEQLAAAAEQFGAAGLDPATLGGLPPEALAALGEALAGQMSTRLSDLARSGLLSGRRLAQLRSRPPGARRERSNAERHASDCASHSGGL